MIYLKTNSLNEFDPLNNMLPVSGTYFLYRIIQETLTLYPIETPFDVFANRADPDQAALVRAA